MGSSNKKNNLLEKIRIIIDMISKSVGLIARSIFFVPPRFK